jgi:hypothetical protein
MFLPAADCNALRLPGHEIIRHRHQAHEVSRNHQLLVDRLAMLAEPRPDVHCVAEIGELSLGVAAFADDDRAGVHPGTEFRRDAEFRFVVGREAQHLAPDGEEARHASRVARRVVRHRPGHDHLVPDIGVHRTAVVADRLVDVEEEARDEIVHPKLPIASARRVELARSRNITISRCREGR